MTTMICKKGDIFYADLSEGVGSELRGINPVIIIQNNIGNKYSPTVVVAAITARIREPKLPTHVKLLAEEYGLKSNSVILLEQVRTIDKIRLREKICTVTIEKIEEIDKSVSISLNIKQTPILSKSEEDDYIVKINRPLVYTEGKTDVKLIQIAWKKLYPDRELFFDCQASGIDFKPDKRIGNAETVRRTIELMSNSISRPVVGIFDNDREGNEQFKGLSKKIFEEYNIKKSVRKHKDTDTWGMLLPVPEERDLFVTDNDITQRYFAIEHYFSDKILKKYNMYGDNILNTCVFKINSKKDKFSDEVNELEAKEFQNFKLLFDRIEEILNKK